MRIRLPRGLSDAAAVAEVADRLAAIQYSGDVACRNRGGSSGDLAVVRDAPGALVVPRVVIGRRDGEAWITTIVRPGDGPVRRPPGRQMAADALGGFTDPRPAPSQFTLTSVMDHDAWGELVAGAVARIDDGALGKVVLARNTRRPTARSSPPRSCPGCSPCTRHAWSSGSMAPPGASPELLIERRGAHVASHPLAGTIGRSGDLATDEALIAGLLASPKERREHAYVIEGLRRTLGPVCDSLEVPDKPTVLELRNVSHLATRLSGVLSAVPDGPAGPGARPACLGIAGGRSAPSRGEPCHPGLCVPSALQLVARVHPTPAVGGTPTDVAVAYIGQVEGFDRGRYACPVGWMDAHGDGSWAIGLRSADVDGDHASIYARRWRGGRIPARERTRGNPVEAAGPARRSRPPLRRHGRWRGDDTGPYGHRAPTRFPAPRPASGPAPEQLIEHRLGRCPGFGCGMCEEPFPSPFTQLGGCPSGPAKVRSGSKRTGIKGSGSSGQHRRPR